MKEFGINNFKNVYIFNVCENQNNSLTTVRKIFDESIKKNKIINEQFIKKTIGNTPTSRRIIRDYKKVNYNFLSIYSLNVLEINKGIIESLHNFGNIDNLKQNYNELLKYKLQERTIQKIQNFLTIYEQYNEFKKRDSISGKIYNLILNNKGPVSKKELIIKLKRNHNVNTSEIIKSLTNLVEDHLIETTSSGFIPKQDDIDDFFLKKENSAFYRLINFMLNSGTPRDASKVFKMSKTQVYRGIVNEIKMLPVFKGETQLMSLLSEYYLNEKTLLILGYTSTKLIRYIHWKYTLHPTKSVIQYIVDKKINNQDANKILFANGYARIEGEILNCRFISVFNKFIHSQNISRFAVPEIFNTFADFCKKNSLTTDYNHEFTVNELCRKLENSKKYLPCGKRKYIVFNIKLFSKDFLSKTNEYLGKFYGHGSTLWFLKKYPDICKKNNISNEYELHATLKRIYSDELEEKIDFGRSPMISTRDMKREDFFKNLILELEPVSATDLEKYICSNFGYRQSSLVGSTSFVNVIRKYKKYNNLLSVTKFDNFKVSDKEIKLIRSFVNVEPIMTETDYFNNLKAISNSGLIEKYKNKNILKEAGYIRSERSIFDKKYGSFANAIKKLSDKLDIVIKQNVLSKYLNLTDISSKWTTLGNMLAFICLNNHDENPSYLNVNKAFKPNDLKSLIEFRDSLCDLLKVNKIYTIKDIKGLISNLNKTRNKIYTIIAGFGDDFILNLISTSSNVSFAPNSKLFAFGIGEPVTNKRIVRDIVKTKRKVHIYELSEMMEQLYGIKFDIYNTNKYYDDIGLYYDAKNKNLYASKDVFDEYLKKWFEGDIHDELK